MEADLTDDLIDKEDKVARLREQGDQLEASIQRTRNAQVRRAARVGRLTDVATRLQDTTPRQLLKDIDRVYEYERRPRKTVRKRRT